MTEAATLERLGLLLVRPGMVVALAPGLGGAFVPARVKVGLTLLLAVTLLPAVPTPAPETAGGLVAIVARECAIGLALASALQALVAGVELAGHISGFQIGYSYAATVDPTTGARNNTVTALFGLVALLTFLGVDGHHAVLRALVASYEGLPIGTGAVGASIVDRVRDVLGLIFTVGARLAMPLVVVMLVVEVAVGLVSRTAPSMGFMVVGYPVRLALGLFVLGLIVGAIPAAVSGLLAPVFELSLGFARGFR